MDEKNRCPEKHRLLEEVRIHLDRIAELTRTASDELANARDDRMRELDTETELEIGKKERGLGALRQHRREHGC